MVTSIHMSTGFLLLGSSQREEQQRRFSPGSLLLSCLRGRDGCLDMTTPPVRGLSYVSPLPGLLELLAPFVPSDIEEDKVSNDQHLPLLRVLQHALLIPL